VKHLFRERLVLHELVDNGKEHHNYHMDHMDYMEGTMGMMDNLFLGKRIVGMVDI
jgi:hypothetical protein